MIDFNLIPIHIVLIVLGAFLSALYVLYRVSFWKKRIQLETKEAEEAVNLSFNQLKEKIEKQVEMLDNEPGLSEKEREVRDKLYEALNSSQELIEKEIKDIKNEID